MTNETLITLISYQEIYSCDNMHVFVWCICILLKLTSERMGRSDYEIRRSMKYFFRKFEQTIRYNPFLHDIVPDQNGNSQCSSDKGPFCTFINYRSVLQKELSPELALKPELFSIRTQEFHEQIIQFNKKDLKIMQAKSPQKQSVQNYLQKTLFDEMAYENGKYNQKSIFRSFWGGFKIGPSLIYNRQYTAYQQQIEQEIEQRAVDGQTGNNEIQMQKQQDL